jgi:hypothetical protein
MQSTVTYPTSRGARSVWLAAKACAACTALLTRTKRRDQVARGRWTPLSGSRTHGMETSSPRSRRLHYFITVGTPAMVTHSRPPKASNITNIARIRWGICVRMEEDTPMFVSPDGQTYFRSRSYRTLRARQWHHLGSPRARSRRPDGSACPDVLARNGPRSAQTVHQQLGSISDLINLYNNP